MINTYKIKFTTLQQEILRFLFINSGLSFNGRNLAQFLKVSATAISKSLQLLEKENLIKIKKDKYSKRLSIELNRDNKKVIELKRVENLRLIYESKLIEYLIEIFPSSTVILFGSYSFGEDIYDSDIDIAIMGEKNKEINLNGFEKYLSKKISLEFYDNFKEMNKNLKENILNGIVLKGGIEL